MPDIWARYSEHKETQNLIKDKGYGCVISAGWIKYVYPDLNYLKPNFDVLDRRIGSLPRSTPIHLHPLINRYHHSHWDVIAPDLEKFVIPILKRYENQIYRFTLANEVLLSGPSACKRVYQLYANISKEFPILGLWLGEYGLRSKFRVKGYLQYAREIREVCPTLQGLTFIDYVDLNSRSSGPFVTGLKNVGMSALLEFALKNVSNGLSQANKEGFKTALETSVFTGPNPSKLRIGQQASIYRNLLNICDKTSTEFWHWNLTDQQCGMSWDKERNKTDCPGWYDRDFNQRFINTLA